MALFAIAKTLNGRRSSHDDLRCCRSGTYIFFRALHKPLVPLKAAEIFNIGGFLFYSVYCVSPFRST